MTYGHLQVDCLYTGSALGPMLDIEYGKTFTFYHRGIDVQNLISIHLAVWHIRDVIWVWDMIHCSRHHKTTVIIGSSDYGCICGMICMYMYM